MKKKLLLLALMAHLAAQAGSIGYSEFESDEFPEDRMWYQDDIREYHSTNLLYDTTERWQTDQNRECPNCGKENCTNGNCKKNSAKKSAYTYMKNSN